MGVGYLADQFDSISKRIMNESTGYATGAIFLVFDAIFTKPYEQLF